MTDEGQGPPSSVCSAGLAGGVTCLFIVSWGACRGILSA